MFRGEIGLELTVLATPQKTWHDIDDQDNWEEIDECVPGKYATQAEVLEFRSTGQVPIPASLMLQYKH